MKFFDQFAESRLGSWTVNGLAVVAFILVLKLISARFLPDQGPAGAVKAAVASI